MNCAHETVAWREVEIEHWITGEIQTVRDRFVTSHFESLGFGRWRCIRCGFVQYTTGSWRDFWTRGIECPGSSLVPPHLRPATMTTTTNRITVEASILPTHDELHKALEAGASLTPIGRLIYDNEPAAPDQAKEFREQVAEALTEHGVNEVARYAQAVAEFKNFHRLLCKRFDYTHDEENWKRDVASLIEHIAAKVAPPSVVTIQPSQDQAAELVRMVREAGPGALQPQYDDVHVALATWKQRAFDADAKLNAFVRRQIEEPPTERALVPATLIHVEDHCLIRNSPVDCSQLPDGAHQLYAVVEVPL